MTKLSYCVPTAVLACMVAACGPSIDPAAKADIDQRVARLAPGGQPFAAPAAFAPRPIAVGQWTQHKMVSDKGEPSFMTYKIVGEENGAYWIEVLHENYTGKTITKMLLFMGDRMNPATMEVRALKMRDKNGHVNELSGPMLQLMKSMWQGSVNLLAVAWQGLPQEDAEVVAGHFAGCFKARTDASYGPWHAASTSWSHPAVPISGLVRSQGIDHPTTMELVAFGDTGATSELP
jgi:hypothetical protein